MANLVVMVGIPGAGKTTITKQYSKKGYKVHSSDDIRLELFGSNYEDSDNSTVFNVMRTRVYHDLKRSYDVVYDATNLSRKKRKELVKYFKKVSTNITYHVVLRDYKELLKYNEQRGFPKNVLRDYIRYFNLPSSYEGYDNIKYTVTNPENINYYNKSYYEEKSMVIEFFKNLVKGIISYPVHPFLKDIYKYDQNNPYHTKQLHLHLEDAFTESLKFKSKELQVSAALHDIGKKFSAHENDKGYTSFYGHENIGAYMLRLLVEKFNLTNELFLDFDVVIDLISFHMRLRNAKTVKSKMKLIKETGEELYPLLCELFVVDVGGK